MKAFTLLAALSFTLLVGCGPIGEIVEETKKEAKEASKSLLEETTGVNIDELLEAKKELGITTLEEGKQAALDHIDGVVSEAIGTSLTQVNDLDAQALIESQVKDVIDQKKTEVAEWLLKDSEKE